jgi:hypothetical protein
VKKFGIRRTWGNIILLFIIGVVLGIVLALRQTPQTRNITTDIIVPDFEAAGSEPVPMDSPSQYADRE